MGRGRRGWGGGEEAGGKKGRMGELPLQIECKPKPGGGVSNGSKEKSMTKSFLPNSILRALTHYRTYLTLSDYFTMAEKKKKRSASAQLGSVQPRASYH